MRMIALKPAHFHAHILHYNFSSLANEVLQRNVQAL
jgi:hypothetical protein